MLNKHNIMTTEEFKYNTLLTMSESIYDIMELHNISSVYIESQLNLPRYTVHKIINCESSISKSLYVLDFLVSLLNNTKSNG